MAINLINNIGLSKLISKRLSLHQFVENIVEIITEEIQEAILLGFFFAKTRHNSAEKKTK